MTVPIYFPYTFSDEQIYNIYSVKGFCNSQLFDLIMAVNGKYFKTIPNSEQ